jgi:hypothetical protein
MWIVYVVVITTLVRYFVSAALQIQRVENAPYLSAKPPTSKSHPMQGFNKYYPPDYDESQGSLNKLNGKHALGDRARKIDQGILITRFELPYNIWCGGCNSMIGMGVRYNSEKKKVGMYYSTPIFSFRCKCHICSNWFEIRTDPQVSVTPFSLLICVN